MLIIDAQVHLWGKGLPTNRSHRQITSFTVDDLLKEMDTSGIDGAVIHPPGWDSDSSTIAVEAALQHPNRLSILGNFPIDHPESQALVPGWKQQPGMLGLRFTFQQPHQQTWLTDGTMDWVWPAAQEAGLPVALAAGNFIPSVGIVAEKNPGVKLIVDHFGRIGGKVDEDAFNNFSELLALSKYPNVAIKATGAPSYSSDPYPFRNIHDYIHQVYDSFGPERMFWGTDITRMPCSWKQCVTLFTEELPWLSQGDKELIMGQALCNWLDWKMSS